MHRYVELPDGHRVELAPRLLPAGAAAKKEGVANFDTQSETTL
jgi:hypothetical protein